MSVIRFKDADLSKTQPCKYFVYMDRGNPSQDWRVIYAKSNIYCDAFLRQSFGTRNSSLANAKLYVLLYRFCFVCLFIF